MHRLPRIRTSAIIVGIAACMTMAFAAAAVATVTAARAENATAAPPQHDFDPPFHHPLPAAVRKHEERVLGPRQAHRFDPLGRESMPSGATPLDSAIAMANFETPFAEQLGAHLRLGWAWSWLGRLFVGAGSGLEEGERPGYFAVMRRQWQLPGKPGDETGFLDKKAWRGSPWYRDGMEWVVLMTEPRARSMADAWDGREYDRWLVKHSPDSFWRGMAGFGAFLLGGLPNLVSFAPVFGPIISLRRRAPSRPSFR